MADLATNLSNAFAAVGADVKKLLAQDGNLSQLTTKQKASLVVAINELDAAVKAIDVKSVISDTASDTTHVWSAKKVGDEITEKCNAVKTALLGGAGEAYDTLQELATLMTTNKDAIAALQEVAAGHVRFDKAQELTGEQQKQARDNIDAPSKGELSTVSGVANAAKSAAAENANAIGSLGTLETTEQTNLVGAINEVKGIADGAKSSAAANAQAIGTLSGLSTSAKGTVVAAINEVKGKADQGISDAAAAQSAADTAQGKADSVEQALNTFKGEVGTTSTDFAGAYTNARDGK